MSYTLRGRLESRLVAALLPLLAACILAAGLPSWWPVGIAGLGVILVVLAVADPGGELDKAWHSFKKPSPVTGERGRLSSGLGSNRYDFYRVALDEFADHPIAGTGVDNFTADYLVRGRNACGLGSYGSSNLTPDPRDSLDAGSPACP